MLVVPFFGQVITGDEVEVVEEVIDVGRKGMLQPATSTESRTSRIELPTTRQSSWYVRIVVLLLYLFYLIAV